MTTNINTNERTKKRKRIKRPGTPNQSIQIEINRSLYMRDARLSAREPHAVPEQIKHIAAVINRFGAFLVTLQPR